MIPIAAVAVRSVADLPRLQVGTEALTAELQLPVRERAAVTAAALEWARQLAESGGGQLSFALRAAPGELIIEAKGEAIRLASEQDAMALSRIVQDADVQRLCLPIRGLSNPEQTAARLRNCLADEAPNAAEALAAHNAHTIALLRELERQQDELAQVNDELEETNRGVVALYAELEERTQYQQRMTEAKSRFLSNMTHEFRTPLNSILSLADILLQRLDGPLTEEQEKQIRFIQQAAEGLSELVNDLLDLAKVDAGKVQIKPVEFRIENLFSTLRGMLRPLLADKPDLQLIFEQPRGLPTLYTDEAKVSQILRNFISNAIKYTERGEVRVKAEARTGDTVVLSVTDTGIGIARADQQRIFDEFTQLDSPLQSGIKGTGLGLPLSRRLAQLLGGNIGVRSTLGEGSTFYTVLPVRYQNAGKEASGPDITCLDPGRQPVLVVEDSREWLYLYQQCFEDSPYQMLPARTLKEARSWLESLRPVAVILDVLLETENTWDFLGELRAAPETAKLPIIVATVVDNEALARRLGADAFHVKPVDREWLLSTLDRFSGRQDKLLIVDPDEISRYLLRDLLADQPFAVIETTNPAEGLLAARRHRPLGIFLDPMTNAAELDTLITALRNDPTLASMRVFAYSSRPLSRTEQEHLRAVAVLRKDGGTRDSARLMLRQALREAGLLTEEQAI